MIAWSLSTALTANSVDLGGVPRAEEQPPPVGPYSGGFTILVVGVDNDPAQGDRYGERGGTLNDVNILVRVADDHRSAVAVSFPRDLVIPHPQCQHPETGQTYSAMSAQPLNVAMSRGGLPCVAQTLASLTGLDIPFAATMTFDAVVRVTDAVGGVSVCLTAPLYDPYIPFSLQAGYSQIAGADALSFLRSRHGVGDGSDLSRISSQQQYMGALLRKLKSAQTLTDLPTLYSLARVVAENAQLSTSLANLDTMVSMARALAGIDLDRITFVQYPGTTGDPRYPGKVVPVKAAADELIARIASGLPVALAEDALGQGAIAAPDAQPPVVPTAAPTGPSTTPAPSGPAPTPAPDVVEGVRGSTADQATCAMPFGG